MPFPTASTQSLGIHLKRSADDVYSYLFPNKVCGFVEWMHKDVLTASGVVARRKYVMITEQCSHPVTLYFRSQRVCDLFGWTH